MASSLSGHLQEAVPNGPLSPLALPLVGWGLRADSHSNWIIQPKNVDPVYVIDAANFVNCPEPVGGIASMSSPNWNTVATGHGRTPRGRRRFEGCSADKIICFPSYLVPEDAALPPHVPKLHEGNGQKFYNGNLEMSWRSSKSPVSKSPVCMNNYSDLIQNSSLHPLICSPLGILLLWNTRAGSEGDSKVLP